MSALSVIRADGIDWPVDTYLDALGFRRVDRFEVPSLHDAARVVTVTRECELRRHHPEPRRRHLRQLRRRRGAVVVIAAVRLCECAVCRSLDRAHPVEGRQLAMVALVPTSSGEPPEALPLPDPDAPAARTADVSAPQGRPVETSARGRQPEQLTHE